MANYQKTFQLAGSASAQLVPSAALVEGEAWIQNQGGYTIYVFMTDSNSSAPDVSTAGGAARMKINPGLGASITPAQWAPDLTGDVYVWILADTGATVALRHA